MDTASQVLLLLGTVAWMVVASITAAALVVAAVACSIGLLVHRYRPGRSFGGQAARGWKRGTRPWH